MIRVTIASVVVVAWIIVLGALADYNDPYSRTAFVLGVAGSAGAFVVADWILRGGEDPA